MMDSSDDESVVAEEVISSPEHDLTHAGEVIIDELDTNDEVLTASSSFVSLTLDDHSPSIKPRPYQLEMVEESLKKNIIVAMDTGSGKTHMYLFCIACLRTSLIQT